MVYLYINSLVYTCWAILMIFISMEATREVAHKYEGVVVCA
jgi:hypothetical protein